MGCLHTRIQSGLSCKYGPGRGFDDELPQDIQPPLENEEDRVCVECGVDENCGGFEDILATTRWGASLYSGNRSITLKSFQTADLKFQWHKIRLVMAEMIHFIRQTQAYCQVEVIECSWEILYQFIQQKKGDLDSLIGAHRSYLDRIVKKVLLRSHKAGREVGTATFAMMFSDAQPRKTYSIK